MRYIYISVKKKKKKKMRKIILISMWPQKLTKEEFRKGFHDWHIRVGEQIWKHTKKYKIECWNPDRSVTKTETVMRNGITFKRFPYIGINPDFGFRGTSFEIIKQLKKEAEENEILVHFHIYSSYLAYHILLNKKYPILAQHHGSTSPLKLIKRKPTFIFAFPLLAIEEMIERVLFKKIDYFFVLTEQEKKDLSQFIPSENIEVQPMAVDFDNFKPIEKISARKKLNLPLNKKIIIYVGRYFEAKGVDKILDSFNEIKKERHDLMLIMIGGYPVDSLYERVKKEANIQIEKVRHSELKYYLSAADVYVMHCNETVKNYGGMGVAPMEALACNTPIVSTNLIHCPEKDREKLGKVQKNEKELTMHLKYILNNLEKYKNCRETARKYFDWKSKIEHTLKVYNFLFKKNYGKRHG
jgi:glycosyltransferase involved in cell wall biosynthesis